jgi:putative serine protease PepD
VNLASDRQHNQLQASGAGQGGAYFFSHTQRCLRMVTVPVGMVVHVTDTGDTTPPPPPPPTPPTWRPYAGSAGASAPTAPLPATRPGDRRRRPLVFAGSVVAASLLVGGGAGVGGAAGYSAWHDEGSSPSSSSGVAPTASKVVDTPATPAAAGSVQAVAAKVLPSVVKIDVSGSQGAGSGSGIILSSDGQILTNNHVVELAGDGGTLRVTFNDGSHADAKVLGTDPLTDTALVQAQNVSGLAPATIGTSGDLAVGQSVVAIGSPLGLEATVTSGIVSALNRPVDVGSVGQGNTTVYPAIQTDAAINPGNSGGALVDLSGNVVGINAAIATAGESTGGESGNIGVGFAIPMDEVMPIVAQMAKGETPTHARLGVSVPASSSGQDGIASEDGATIQKVNAGSTAEKAGIVDGDVITKIDDHLITDADSLIATIRSYRPGDQVTVTYTHGGETKTAQLTLDSDSEASNS